MTETGDRVALEVSNIIDTEVASKQEEELSRKASRRQDAVGKTTTWDNDIEQYRYLKKVENNIATELAGVAAIILIHTGLLQAALQVNSTPSLVTSALKVVTPVVESINDRLLSGPAVAPVLRAPATQPPGQAGPSGEQSQEPAPVESPMSSFVQMSLSSAVVLGVLRVFVNEMGETKMKLPVSLPIAHPDVSAEKPSGADEAASSPKFQLEAAVGMVSLPDPRKGTAGEDAFLLEQVESGCLLGVADGVGGWSKHGVDSAVYSNKFMQLVAEELCEAEGGVGASDMLRALQHAHAGVEDLGSATVCLAALTEARTLTVANLGDSGAVVVRKGEVVFATASRQHFFNCPYQFSWDGEEQVADMDLYTFQVEPQDLVVVASDGLFDNIFPSELARMAAAAGASGAPPRAAAANLARQLARAAQTYGRDTRYFSPFAYSAVQSGVVEKPLWSELSGISPYRGGKLDDTTVLVAIVGDERS